MIPEVIQQNMADEMDARYPDGRVEPARTTFFRGCEYGYSLASSEIEALKKEVETAKRVIEGQARDIERLSDCLDNQ